MSDVGDGENTAAPGCFGTGASQAGEPATSAAQGPVPGQKDELGT